MIDYTSDTRQIERNLAKIFKFRTSFKFKSCKQWTEVLTWIKYATNRLILLILSVFPLLNYPGTLDCWYPRYHLHYQAVISARLKIWNEEMMSVIPSNNQYLSNKSNACNLFLALCWWDQYHDLCNASP